MSDSEIIIPDYFNGDDFVIILDKTNDEQKVYFQENSTEGFRGYLIANDNILANKYDSWDDPLHENPEENYFRINPEFQDIRYQKAYFQQYSTEGFRGYQIASSSPLVNFYKRRVFFENGSLRITVRQTVDGICNICSNDQTTYALNIKGDSSLEGYKLKSVQIKLDNSYFNEYEWKTNFNNENLSDTWVLSTSGKMKDKNISLSNTLEFATKIELGNCDFEVFRISPNHNEDGNTYSSNPISISNNKSTQIAVWDSNNSRNITFRSSELFNNEKQLEIINL